MRRVGLFGVAFDRWRRAGVLSRRKRCDAPGAEQEERRGHLEMSRAGKRPGCVLFGRRGRSRRNQTVRAVVAKRVGRRRGTDRQVLVALLKAHQQIRRKHSVARGERESYLHRFGGHWRRVGEAPG